jgi:hypothetical protein
MIALARITTTRTDRYGATTTYATIVRAELRAPSAIMRQTTFDLRGLLHAAGGITADDLAVVGWTPAQIKLHATDAIARARRLARTDGGEGMSMPQYWTAPHVSEIGATVADAVRLIRAATRRVWITTAADQKNFGELFFFKVSKPTALKELRRQNPASRRRRNSRATRPLAIPTGGRGARSRICARS